MKNFTLILAILLTITTSYSQRHIVVPSEYTNTPAQFYSKTKTGYSSIAKDSAYDVVGRWGWGLNHAVASDGKYLYVGNGEVFQILDATDPVNLKVIGEITLYSGGVIHDIIVKGNYAYVACGPVFVLDISDPKNIIFEVYIDLKIQTWQIAIDDTTLYAGNTIGFVYVVNITNPKLPVIGDFWYLDRNMCFYTAGNGYFYHASIADPTVAIFRLVNRDSLELKGVFTVPGHESAMTVKDSLLVFAAGVNSSKSSLVFYSLSDPSRPKYLSTFEFSPGGAYPNSITVTDNIAYVTAEESRRLFVIDISNIYQPVVKQIINSSQFYPTKAVKRNKILYVPTLTGLWILNGSMPDSLKDAGMYVTGGLSRRLVLRDSLLFVASEYVGLSILNVSDPVSPKRIGNVLLWGKSHKLILDGDYAYVANDAMSSVDTSSGIWIIDIKDVNNPKIITHIPNIFQDWSYSGIAAIKKNGRNLFVLITNSVVFPGATPSDTILKVFDVSNIKAPVLTSFYRQPFCDPPDIEVNDSLIFLSLADQRLKVLQYTPTSIIEKTTLPFGAYGLWREDSILYVVADTFRTINVKTLAEISSTVVHLQSWDESVLLSNSKLYISTGSDQYIYKVEKNFTLTNKFYAYLHRAGRGVDVSGNIVYYSLYDNGVTVLDISKSILFVSESKNQLFNNYGLSQNYPNPFNPSTQIEFQISQKYYVTLKIYDMLGREVATLVNEEKEAGAYTATFNAQSLASGIYFYEMRAHQTDGQRLDLSSGQAGSYVSVKKMLLMK